MNSTFLNINFLIKYAFLTVLQFLLLIILITRHIPTQGGGGVRVPGGVQKMCGCCMGTRFSGGMVLVGGWLDWMVLEVFSSLGDSMIL